MKRCCSLKLNLEGDGENQSWRLHRLDGSNLSTNRPIKIPKNISPAEILSSLNNALDIPDIVKIRTWGNQIWYSIFHHNK